MPIGKRPVPRVAKGKGSAGQRGGTGGAYSGVSASKSPIGNRPTPRVAKNNPNFAVKTNKVRPSPKFTKMRNYENEQAHHLKGRSAGGG